MGRQASALGADGVFDYLYEDFLTMPEEVGDIGIGRIGLQVLVFFGEKNIREIIENAARLPDVQKCVAGKADVDESRLHPGKYAVDTTLVKIPDD